MSVIPWPSDGTCLILISIELLMLKTGNDTISVVGPKLTSALYSMYLLLEKIFDTQFICFVFFQKKKKSTLSK